MASTQLTFSQDHWEFVQELRLGVQLQFRVTLFKSVFEIIIRKGFRFHFLELENCHQIWQLEV